MEQYRLRKQNGLLKSLRFEHTAVWPFASFSYYIDFLHHFTGPSQILMPLVSIYSLFVLPSRNIA